MIKILKSKKTSLVTITAIQGHSRIVKQTTPIKKLQNKELIDYLLHESFLFVVTEFESDRKEYKCFLKTYCHYSHKRYKFYMNVNIKINNSKHSVSTILIL